MVVLSSKCKGFCLRIHILDYSAMGIMGVSFSDIHTYILFYQDAISVLAGSRLAEGMCWKWNIAVSQDSCGDCER